MNLPETIERTVAGVLKSGAIGAATVVRCWHCLRDDYKWTPDADLTYPCIDVRCGPPKTDDNQSTLTCSVAITLCTKTADDQDHAAINMIETEAQAALDAVYADYRKNRGSGTGAFAVFAQEIESAGTGLHVGGISYGDVLAPYDDDGVNVVGLSLVVHYSRNDFN